MCELLGMSSLHPTDIGLSLHAFAKHGGKTGPHSDGWGVAYAMGRDFRLIKEPEPAAHSECVRFIESHSFNSQLVISHIRRASKPKRLNFENTHPFDRELGGRRFVLAHNGDVRNVANLAEGVASRFSAMGSTDSEALFCLIMNHLALRLKQGAGMDGMDAAHYRPAILLDVLEELTPALQERGKCNLLLSDGELLFAVGDNKLHWTARHCEMEGEGQLEGEGLRVRVRHPAEQQVALVATVPLTGEPGWTPLRRGEILVFRHGEIVEHGALRSEKPRPKARRKQHAG